MKIHQKERLLNLITEIRNTTFYDPSFEPELAEAGIYILQGQLHKLKIYVQRIDDNFIKSEVDKIDLNFSSYDQQEAIGQYNRALPILDEIEDFLLFEDYESISKFNLENPKKQSIGDQNSKNIQKIKKELITGNLENAINELIPIFQDRGISDDELILAQNRLSTLKSEYEKGLISFEDFLRFNTGIVISIISKMNELK